jgi:dipeptidyl aminopeptidase/acylaminoacyl peptidase
MESTRKLLRVLSRRPRTSLALIFAFGLCVAFVVRVAIRNYSAELLNFTPWPAAEVAKHPEQAGISGLASVELRTRAGYRLAGWYVPSTNRAAIVLAHGTHADRASLLPEARILAEAGFGVLAFDWPGYGQSEREGKVRWGVNERAALGTALDWLAARDDVDKDRIGGFGLSMGGYILAQVAAGDPRLHAVVLAATPSEMIEQTRYEHRRWWLLSEEPAEWALRSSGMAVEDLVPVKIISEISPRPVFVLGGDADPIVPESMTRQLFDAAHDPKRLWIVPGAMHGGYATTAPDLYRQHLVDFFLQSLVEVAPHQ